MVEEVEECPEELLDEREIYWIAYYDSVDKGYNLTYGGGGSVKYTDKELLSAWNDGGTLNDISNRIGMTKCGISERLRALGITSEEINQRRFSVPGCRSIPIYQYGLDGKFIKAFPSYVAAIEEVGCLSIRNAGKGGTHTAGGFQWREYKVDHIDPYDSIKIGGKKTVYQYTLDGRYIRSFNSAKEAAASVGTDYVHLCEACQGKSKSSNGYQWSYEYHDMIPPAPKNRGNSKPVEQYSLDGTFIALYESSAEAARTYGVDMSTISAACKGKSKTSCGYIWKYADTEKEVT